MLDLRSSVYARVILFMAAVCLAVLGLDIRQSWTARDTRLQEARTDTDNLTRSLAQHTQDIFETTDAVVNGLVDTLVSEGWDETVIQRLERRMRMRVTNQQLLHGLFIFDQNGHWVASSLGSSVPAEVRNLNYADRPFFQYHREHAGDAILVSPPIRSRTDGSWAITVTRRIDHPDGGFAGVVDASISIEHFQRFFETFDVGQHGVIALTSGQGTIIARRPFDDGNIGRNIAQGEFFHKIPASAASGGFDYTSLIDGTSRLSSFRRVPGFDLIMSVAFDQNEVLAPWRHETKVHLMWSAVISLFIMVLGYRLTLQIRDRVAAEAVARKLWFEADQHRDSEAERRAYARELEQQKRELERSNAALEQFAYAASHDLQAPLRAIAHLAQWIDEDVRATASSDTIDNLLLLNGRVARLQMLTSGLLAYARVGRGNFPIEDVDLAAAVQDIVAILSPRPNFLVACEPDMPAIRTHRTPLQLVLRNLISNALQHHDRDQGRVGISMRIVDDMAEISVGDDGAGIEPRFHDEIFVIFKTLHSRDEVETGGMGLAMVKKLVTENGGYIRVESNPPARGSTFVFTWKLSPPG